MWHRAFAEHVRPPKSATPLEPATPLELHAKRQALLACVLRDLARARPRPGHVAAADPPADFLE